MSEFSFEELQQMRVANIQSQFVNSEELQKGEQDELEKARHGTYSDTAKNRKLNRVGQEYGHKAEEKQPSGQRTKKTEETSGAGGKTVADHAADTDSKVLKKVVDDPDAKPELKEAAQSELKKRGESETKKQMTREEFVEKMRQDGVSEEDIKRFQDFEEFGDSIAEQIKQEKQKKTKKPLRRKMFSKEDVKVKAAESLRSAFEKLSEEYEKVVYYEDGSMDTDAALAADDKFLKEVHRLIVNGELDKKTFLEVRRSNPDWKYGFDGMPSYEEIRDDEEYMSDEEKNSPDFGAKRFKIAIQKFLKEYDKLYEDDYFHDELAEKVDKEFNESVYKLIKNGKLDKKTFEETKKKFKGLEYSFDLPTYEEYKKHNF